MAPSSKRKNRIRDDDDDDQDDRSSLVAIGHDEDEDHDDDVSVSTQKHKKKRIRASLALNVAEHNFSYGSIEKVELVNFMCHEFLQISLGKKINFIVGHNGSGKSAILTALMVCLGGKASITSRGTNIQALLKEGTNVGSVTVTLRNEGDEPYRGDEYGDRIIIERKIVRNGSSNYKIQSASGKVVSNKREELVSICDYFNIDVSNPMSILTQDTARMFLASGTSHDKYICFLKGTQLESLRSDYETIDELLITSKRITDKKSQHLPDLEKDVIALEKQLDRIKAARHLEVRVIELQNEFMWSSVNKLEEILANKKREENIAARKFEKSQEKIDESIQEKEALEHQLIETREQREKLFAITEPIVSRRAQLLQEARELSSRERALRAELQDREHEKRENENMLKRLEPRIREQEQKLSVDQNAIRNQKLRQISDLEQQKAKVDAGLVQVRDQESQLAREGDGVNSSMEEFRQQIAGIKNELRTIDHRIYQADQQGGDQLKRFNENMPNMVRMIEDYARQGRWRSGKPIGPIGLHVKLKDASLKKYIKVIETCLQHSLNSFITNDEQDLRLLQEIKRRTRCDVPIIKSRRRNIDFSSGEPDQQYLTILRALTFDHRAVLDVLVIQEEIEKIVLVDDRQEGDRVTSRGYPRNVKKVVTKDCQSMGTRSGERSLMWMNEYNGPPRLVPDMTQYKQHLEEDKHARVQEISRLEQELSRANDHIRQLTRQQRDLATQRMNLNREGSRVENQIHTIQESIEEEESDLLSLLQTERARCLEALEVIQGQIDRLTQAVLEKQAEAREAAQASEAVTNELEQFEEKKNLLLQAEHDISVKVARADTEIRHYTKKHRDYQEGQQNLEREVNQLAEEVKLHEQRCLDRCERVQTNRLPEEVNAEMVEAEARLHQSHEEFGSFEEVNSALVAKRVEYEKVLEEINGMQELIRAVKASLNARLRAYVDLRQMISIRSKRLFAELLQKRGYRGVLELDHEKEVLHLHVDVRDEDVEDDRPAQQQRAGGNNERRKRNKDEGAEVLALSGGEKSFATVCLLLSLWASMSSPFRALDEFDVFMDATNRQLAMQLMIDEARAENNSSQYLLITPQNMSKVKGMNGPDIRICKLSDPERGQTRLNFPN